MKMILEQWSFIRLIRLILGLSILIEGIFQKDPLRIIFGSLFSGLALANIGCCGTSVCSVNLKSSKSLPLDTDH